MSQTATTTQDATMIRIRLDALRGNLEQAQDALNQVRQRRNEIRAVWAALYSEENSIYAATSAVEEPLRAAAKALGYEAKVREGPGGKLDEIKKQLEEAVTAMDTLGKRLDYAQGLTRAIQQRAVDVPDDLASRFKAKTSLDRIGPLQDELAPITAGGPPASGRSSDEVIAEAWTEYESILEKEAARLFAEYIDLIGGLALRDSGWDNDVCEIADALIRRCSMVGGKAPVWYSMTVPARREAMAETLARIIRLGFPEWTIWAVPLGAHEFGHVVVKQNASELKVPRQPPAGGGAYLAHYLADVFATYALGPSYACAAILLRLDPWRVPVPGASRPPDANRATVVLQTLERMNKKTKNYTELIARLEEAWVAASKRRDPAADPFPTDAWVTKAVKNMWQFLESGGVAELYFSGERWLAVEEWHAHLSKKGGAEEVEWGKEHEVRDLLSAAWDARSRYPTKTAVIEAEVHDLWKKMRGGAQPRQSQEIRT